MIGAAAFSGGCNSLYAAFLALAPLLVFIIFIIFVIRRSIGPDGPLLWQPSSLRQAVSRLKTTWHSGHLVRRDASAAVLEAIAARGCWVERVDTVIDRELTVCELLSFLPLLGGKISLFGVFLMQRSKYR